MFDYTNGDLCPNMNISRKSRVFFVCDENREHDIVKVDQGSCHYFILIKSKYACPSTD